MNVGIDSEELMSRAVEMIVICAQMNEHFSFMYADLCRKITDTWSKGTENEEEESLGKAFRIRLLQRCQEEFSVDRVKKLEDIRAVSKIFLFIWIVLYCIQLFILSFSS